MAVSPDGFLCVIGLKNRKKLVVFNTIGNIETWELDFGEGIWEYYYFKILFRN